MGYDVWGVGTLAVDVLNKVDMLPGEDGFCVVESSERQPGGSGTNVIVQLARLGARCGYSGAVGDDDLGKEVIASLKQEGVDAGEMVIKPGAVTLHTEIVIDRRGSKFIMLNMGDAFGMLEEKELPIEKLRTAKVFYTDLLPKKAALAGLRMAKEAGVTTVCNLQVGLETMEGLGYTGQDILDALQYVDVFAPCREGLYALTHTQELDTCAKALREYCSGILLFTLGSKGSVAYDRDDRRTEVSCRRVDAVDTTGAGDSYIGSFIYSYCLRKKPLETSMEFASACAAHTCMRIGARVSPHLEEVKHELG